MSIPFGRRTPQCLLYMALNELNQKKVNYITTPRNLPGTKFASFVFEMEALVLVVCGRVALHFTLKTRFVFALC